MKTLEELTDLVDEAISACGLHSVARHRLDSALRELIADAERQPALLDVANRMCQLIPEGWELRLCMERGAAWVDLRNEAGDCIELPDPGDAPLHQQMERAVAISIEEDAYAASKG